MRYSLLYRKIVFFFLFFFIVSGVSAEWNGNFQAGWDSFHSLQKNNALAKYRSHWLSTAEKFQRAYSADPYGSYAPKSLYYLGRVYEELAERSYLHADRLKALDYFQRVLNRFGSHAWADDAHFRMARIYAFQLREKEKAIQQLHLLLQDYPKGDMALEAKKLLRKLENKDAKQRVVKEKKQEKSLQEKSFQPAVIQKNIPVLQGVRHWSSNDYTRVVLDLDQEVNFTHHLLKPDPKITLNHRLVVDLEKADIGKEVQEEKQVSDGVLRNIRVGQYRPQQARIVLDIENIRNTRIFSLSNPFRIVLDIFSDEKTKSTPEYIVKKETDKKTITVSSEKKKIAQNIVEQLGLKVKTVMLDAGHGGKDPGAMASKMQEKDVNLRLVKILGKKLEQKGYTVLYTRKKDIFIPLEERTALANSGNVDIFISIHCNAHSKSSANGLEVYYLNLAKSESAVRVAARENAVSEKKISDLQFILTDLMLNSKITESRDLANIVHNKSLIYISHKYPVKSHGVHEAPFYVLMGAKMPAILIELGYLTNKKEARNLGSKRYLDVLAEGICYGIDEYRNKIERYSNGSIK